MDPATVVRIVRDVASSTMSPLSLAWRDARNVAKTTRNAAGRHFVRHLVADWTRYGLGRPAPVRGETLGRADAAAQWLARAQDAVDDGGLSFGYFPGRGKAGWQPSYPETTGYTIPTLYDYADATGREDFASRATAMAHFETRCQLASGGICAGTVRGKGTGVAVAFNTGMVLLGLVAASRRTGDTVFAASARRAAQYLVADVGPDGHFRTHGPFVHPHSTKTYACLCAWPLWLAGEQADEPRWREAACRVGDATLLEQRPSGWFDNNCLSERTHAPLLHTIGYTLQGLLELGIHSGRAQYVDAAKRGVEALLPRCADGFLHGRWYEDWQPAAFASCLTGSAQVAVVCYRLADHTGETRYRTAADAVLDYLKALQSIDSTDLAIRGAIGGSFPMAGAYMRYGYPSWAAKFYLDALLWQDRFQRRDRDATNARTSHASDLSVSTPA